MLAIHYALFAVCRWYVSVNFTDPNLVQQSYIRGHEIATHTISHVANPNATEIVGAKLWLNQVRLPAIHQCALGTTCGPATCNMNPARVVRT